MGKDKLHPDDTTTIFTFGSSMTTSSFQPQSQPRPIRRLPIPTIPPLVHISTFTTPISIAIRNFVAGTPGVTHVFHIEQPPF